MKLNLVERRSEVRGVESFIFEPREPLTWTAGQYIHYVLHHEPTDERGSDRWFTVSSAPYEQRVMITTRLAGEEGSSFKKKLASLAIGKSIEMSVVEGDFSVEDPSREYVFIAGGIGITPFRSILTQADHDGVKLKATLIYANRNEDIVFKGELESFTAKNPELSIRYVIDPQRIDENVIRECVPDLAKPLFYISGPEPMVKALAEVLKGMGVPEENVKLDDFPGYPEY